MMNTEKSMLSKYKPEYLTERHFTLIVYHTKTGRIITSLPRNRKEFVTENLYSELSLEESRRLYDMSADFLRIPVLCILSGKAVIVVRSLQSEFGLGVLLVFEEEPNKILELSKEEKLPFLIIDEETTKDLKFPKDKPTPEWNISEIYLVILNALYEYDGDTQKTVFSLADLAGCRLNLSDEAEKLIVSMDENERRNLCAILFMIFMFVGREGAKREVNITSELLGDGEPAVSLSSELYFTKEHRFDNELVECLRIADELGLFYEDASEKKEYGKITIVNKLNIKFRPKKYDVSLLGIKRKIDIEY